MQTDEDSSAANSAKMGKDDGTHTRGASQELHLKTTPKKLISHRARILRPAISDGRDEAFRRY
jgi:hypothetical protein